MRFSLVVATLGRDRDLALLFDSLLAQGRADFEVIVIDQNADDRLVPIIADYAPRMALLHRRSTRNNANHARNLGLRLARGEIVGFPDDDCLYPPGLLDQVDAAFADPALQVLTGPAASPEGGLGSGRWRTEAGPITAANVWTSVIEFNLFLRRATALALGGFDETLGPGTSFGSAEGNDLVLRAIAAGQAARYAPAQRIIHPDKRLTPVAVHRAVLYGRGFGHVVRRHALPVAIWLPFLIRPVGGALLNALRGRFLAARYFLASLAGRVAGYCAPRSPAVLPPLEEAPR